MLTSSVLMCLVVMVVMVVEGQRVMRRGGNDDDNIPDCIFGPSTYQEKDDERSRIECPDRAVCADVWNTVRDWYNGTRCRDYRVMFNCLCPTNTQCPIHDPAHVLYANDKQSQYLCRPACELEACRTGLRAAKEMVRSMTNQRYGYYRMNCRCANHHVPLSSRGRRGRLNRATVYDRMELDRRNRLVFTQFKCSRMLEEGQDPCQ